jgi:hypothetical protein
VSFHYLMEYACSLVQGSELNIGSGIMVAYGVHNEADIRSRKKRSMVNDG